MKSKMNNKIVVILILLMFVIMWLGVGYLFEKRTEYDVVFFGVGFLIYIFSTDTLFRNLIYRGYEEKSDYANVAIIQALLLLFIMLVYSLVNDEFAVNNLLAFIVVSIIMVVYIILIRSNMKKIPVDKPRRVKIKYYPSKEKFHRKTEEYIKYKKDDYSKLLSAILSDSIESDLINDLSVKIIRKDYCFRKGVPYIHYEAVVRDLWFQISLSIEGLLLMFDGFVPNSKYQTDDYFDYDSFNSREDMYKFIMEAFNHYNDRVMKNNLDSNEMFVDYFNDK